MLVFKTFSSYRQPHLFQDELIPSSAMQNLTPHRQKHPQKGIINQLQQAQTPETDSVTAP